MSLALAEVAEGRHPSTQQITRWFAHEHLPTGLPKHLSAICGFMAVQVLTELPDSPELVAGLRKLLEAKDAFVRAAIAAGEK